MHCVMLVLRINQDGRCSKAPVVIVLTVPQCVQINHHIIKKVCVCVCSVLYTDSSHVSRQVIDSPGELAFVDLCVRLNDAEEIDTTEINSGLF